MKRLILTILLTLVFVPESGMAQEAVEIPNPLSWNDCVNLALQNNVSLLQAETQLEEAEGAKYEFRSRALPQVNATALTFPPLAVLDIRQMVFDQRAILAWEASSLAGSVSRLNYELRINEVMTSLRLAYLNLMLVQEQEKLTRQLQDFLTTRRKNAQSMFETGNLRKSELEQIEVRLSLVRDALILLLDQKQQAQTGLLAAMGVGTEMGEVTGDFDTLPARAVDRSRILNMGVTGMPEVRLLEKLAEASDYQARIARADRYPNIYFFARAEYSPSLDDVIGGDERSENTVTTTATAAGAVGGALTGGGTGGSGSGTTIDPTTDTTGLGDVNSNQVGSDDDDEFEQSRGLFGFQLRWNAYDAGSSEGRAVRREADRDESRVTALQFKQVLPGQVEEASREIEMAREVLLQHQGLPTIQEALEMAQSEYEEDRAGQNETLVFALDSFQMHSRLLQEKYRASVGMTILRRITGQLLAFGEESAM
ncbi:MAG: TolC family protein [Verrucomicrobiota bacterium]